MLNSSTLLSYIKGNIGFPWQFIELTDTEIIDYVKKFSLHEFSNYFPDSNTIGLSLLASSNKVAGKANEYYITDPEGRSIFNVSNIYFSGGNQYIFGQPPLGPMSLMEIPQWVLSNEIAGWVKSFSSWNYTYVFSHPNIIRISPTPTSENWVAVEYEREHAEDFSTVPNSMIHYFLELSLADIMIMIGRIRKKYASGGLKTPFGDIPISDEIFDEGKERKAAVLEKLTVGPLTNVLVSFG